jgi:hypothetical protein
MEPLTTMGFSMPCCKKAGDVGTWARVRLFLGCLWVLLGVFGTGVTLAAEPGVAGTGMELSELRLERGEDQLQLSATVRFELPALVVEAAEKGIPLYFVAEASLQKKRWYWYDKQVSTALRYYRLAYQPLTRRWRLQVANAPINYSGLGVTLGQSFEEMDAALAVVQRIANWKIAPLKEVAVDGKEELSFSFKLDVSQLPRPFQFGVSDRADWNLSVNHTLPLTVELVR